MMIENIAFINAATLANRTLNQFNGQLDGLQMLAANKLDEQIFVNAKFSNPSEKRRCYNYLTLVISVFSMEYYTITSEAWIGDTEEKQKYPDLSKNPNKREIVLILFRPRAGKAVLRKFDITSIKNEFVLVEQDRPEISGLTGDLLELYTNKLPPFPNPNDLNEKKCTLDEGAKILGIERPTTLIRTLNGDFKPL